MNRHDHIKLDGTVDKRGGKRSKSCFNRTGYKPMKGVKHEGILLSDMDYDSGSYAIGLIKRLDGEGNIIGYIHPITREEFYDETEALNGWCSVA